MRCHLVGCGKTGRMQLAMQLATQGIAVDHLAVIRVYDDAVPCDRNVRARG